MVYSWLFSKSKNLISLQGLIQSAITITILGDFGFLLWQDCKVDPLKAIDIYERCPSIRDAISQATDQALKTYFDHAQEDDGTKKQLREEIVQIAFDNRLPTELLKDPIVTGKKESSEAADLGSKQDRKRDGFIKRLFSKRL